MATIQEMQKARELMKTGLTLKDAVAQARTQPTPVQPVQNTPVAGQAPTVSPTPTQTAPTNKEILSQNQANRQAMIQSGAIPDVGQSFQEKPKPIEQILPNNGKLTPEDQAKIDKMDAEGRFGTPTSTPITPTEPTKTPEQTKAEEIKAKNEAQMALNKQKSEQRQAERDAQMTQANNQLASDENAIFNTLKSGGIIPEVVKSSPNYKNALNTYNKLQQYSSYSVGQLTTALDNGAILPGTSLYNEMMKDPAMKTKLTEAQIFTTGKATQPQYETVTQEILSSNPTTASYLADGVITQDEWDQATNSAEVVAKAKDVEEKTNKYNELMAEYDAIEDEVNAQFPGSPFADSIIADRQKAKYKNVILAKGEMDTANGTLTELKTKAASLFETNLNLYETRRAEQMQIDAEKREEARTIAGEQRQMQNSLALSQMEFDQKIKQQAQMMNDPNTAISTMIDEYKKLGVPFERSTQQIIADFQSSGLDLPTYLTNLQKTIQSKPEYKAMSAYQMSQYAPKETTPFQLANLGDGRAIMYNQATGEYQQINAGAVQTASQSPSTIAQYSQQARGKTNLQCGELVNDYWTQFTGNRAGMGDTYQSKLDAINKAGKSDTPQVGGMFVLDTGTSTGHTGIVTGVNGNQITVLEANRAGKKEGEPPVENTYTISDKFIFSNPPSTGATGTQVSQGDDLTTILRNSKLGEGAKTNVAKIQGVIEAIDTFAKNNPTGDIPGVSKGISFDIFSSPESIANRGYLDTINLIVQQWASGASLTESQIKQVNKLVPGEYDTDATVRAKLNNLRNFMNDQVKATLNVSGISYNPVKKDLWASKSQIQNTNTGAGQISPQDMAELQKLLNQ